MMPAHDHLCVSKVSGMDEEKQCGVWVGWWISHLHSHIHPTAHVLQSKTTTLQRGISLLTVTSHTSHALDCHGHLCDTIQVYSCIHVLAIGLWFPQTKFKTSTSRKMALVMMLNDCSLTTIRCTSNKISLKPKLRFWGNTEPKPKPRFWRGSKLILRPH